MTIDLSWWDARNLGDALNPYLFRALGKPVRHARPDIAELIAVGSYMERLLIGAAFNERRTERPIAVWGTGFQFEPGAHLWFKNIRQPEVFIRPVVFHALRGKLSRARAEAITGTELRQVRLGDPGLLTGLFIDTSDVKKRYRLGVVSHFADNGNGAFDRILRDVSGSTRIDVEGRVIDIVRQIASCEAIISSAMHPLITADSLRVPNRWVNVSENSVSRYKFRDYYSVFGVVPEFFDLNVAPFGERDLARLHDEYSITDQQVREVQEGLLHACPVGGSLRLLTRRDAIAMYLRGAIVRDRVLSAPWRGAVRRWRTSASTIKWIVRRLVA